MKLGVFGGTFDPVHNGHLAVAGEVRRRLELDRVLFVPAGQPWLKEGSPITPAEHRLRMVQLAIGDEPGYGVSTVEIDREGPSYTLDTLAELRVGLGADDQVYLIVGWDSLAQFPRWRAPERIIRLCYLVAVPRPGCPRPDLAALEADVPGLSERARLLDEPQVDISATDIRKRVARGLFIHGLVPRAVERYIRERGLYRAASD